MALSESCPPEAAQLKAKMNEHGGGEGGGERGGASNGANGKGISPLSRAPPPPIPPPSSAGAPLDFRTYMAMKTAKLELQFNEYSAGISSVVPSSSSSRIFEGVVIHVNGLTNPTNAELREIMARHGGGHDNYLQRRVTHVVASNLADTKAIAVDRSSGSGPTYVRPEWVTASLRAGRLLPVREFLLRPAASALLPTLPGQRKLFEKSGGAGVELARADPDKGASARSSSAAAVWPPPRPPTSSSSPSPAAAAAAALAAARRARAQSELLKGAPKSTADVSSERFVGTFYRASRLHFIGSWRSRYESLSARLRLEDEERKCSGRKPLGEFDQPVAAASGEASVSNSSSRALLSSSAAAAVAPARNQNQQQKQQRLVIHLDMDCFFASVSVAKTPAYRGQPLVVCHSSGEGGRREEVKEGRNSKRKSEDDDENESETESEKDEEDEIDFFAGGEVSCPCYLARSFGIRAGMGVALAKKLCPSLIAVPYDFDSYAKASNALHSVLLRCGRKVQALSCDEALVDASGMTAEEACEFAQRLRRAVFEATGGCPASCGVGPNPLLARLATKKAKPDGTWCLPSLAEAELLLTSLKCDELPGIGWSNGGKLERAGLKTVSDIRSAGEKKLAEALKGGGGGDNQQQQQHQFNATVQFIWDAAHGRDDREVTPLPPRKSIGIECNWGVRFGSSDINGGLAEADEFLLRLCFDLASRLRCAGVAFPGALTLKVKVRSAGAGAPRKHLGHGICDNLSRSFVLPRPSAMPKPPRIKNDDGGDDEKNDGEEEERKEEAALASRLASAAKLLLRQLGPPRPEEIRGMGIVASKLRFFFGPSSSLPSLSSPSPRGWRKRDARQTDLNALLVPRRPGEGDAPVSPPPGATKTTSTPRKKTPLPCDGWIFDSDSSSSDEDDQGDEDDEEDVPAVRRRLPRPKELDMSVMDCLPLALKREIERALEEEEERRRERKERRLKMEKRGATAQLVPSHAVPPLRQARLEQCGCVLSPSPNRGVGAVARGLSSSLSSGEKKKRKASSASTTTTPSPTPKKKRGGNNGSSDTVWTTPTSEAKRKGKRDLRFVAGGGEAAATSTLVENDDDGDDDDFGGHAVAEAVLSFAACSNKESSGCEDGEFAGAAFDVAVEWARKALLSSDDAEGALRVARAFLQVAVSSTSASSDSAGTATIVASAARSALYKIQDAAREALGAPLLLSLPGQRGRRGRCFW